MLQLSLEQTTRRALENPLLRTRWNVAGSSTKRGHQIVISGSDKMKNRDDGQALCVSRAAFERADGSETRGHDKRLLISDYARVRDMTGSFWRSHKPTGSVHVHLVELSDEEILGALVGIGLAAYAFRNFVRERDEKDAQVQLSISKDKGPIERELIDTAQAIATGMNLARHIANLPAAVANPDALAKFFKKYFGARPGVSVDVWGVDRLQKEKMGLLLAVGQGSQWGSRLVHLRYRPGGKGSSRRRASETRPLAFVGKGVTFDTGGLDIKPASGMRLMKKDVSGAAIVAGLCDFVSRARLNTPCDFYLPLAENSVSDRAMRPGDVFLSRAGHYVEIDNTDAEGRLVMADAFDVALTQSKADAPEALVDVSTLTGAMRVAVGLDVAGFFSNDDELAAEAEQAAQKMGELAWRMPLVKKYEKFLSSQFADFKNSSDSGFGGAITAALFLQKFIRAKDPRAEREIPWLHFDVMAWNNSGDGAMAEGSNAQTLQILIGMLLRRA